MPYEGAPPASDAQRRLRFHVDATSSDPRRPSAVRAFLRHYRWPLLLIVLPTLLTAVYYGLFAAKQYVSEATFLVRSSQGAPAPSSLIGQMLSGGSAPPSEEASGVANYLVSHDAAKALQAKLDIISMFRRVGIDLPSRIKDHPTDEDLTQYYRHHVKVTLDNQTGLLTLEVRAFRPEDSKAIADALLVLGEQLVNRLSERAESDAVRLAQAEVGRAQKRLLDLSDQMTQFRQSRQSLDPAGAASMVTGVMGGLESELAVVKAQSAAARNYFKPDNPRIKELDSEMGALSAQIANQKDRLTGSSGSLAPTVAGYDRLKIEQEFADRDYASAMTAYEGARVDAAKQHLYLARVVEPNLPQKSLYPKRWLTILTVFVGLMVAYGIGWIILTGTREHAI